MGFRSMPAVVGTLGLVTAGAVIYYKYQQRKIRSQFDSVCNGPDSESSDDEQVERRYFSGLFRIPRDLVGYVIGRHGRTLHQIEKETKAFLRIIYFSKAELQNAGVNRSDDFFGDFAEEPWGEEAAEENSRDGERKDEFAFVKIEASTNERVTVACAALQCIVEEARQERTTITLKFLSSLVPHLIGKRGSKIREINHGYHVRTRFEPDEENPMYRLLHISGKTRNVLLAEQRIETMLRKHREYNEKNQSVEQTLANIRAASEENAVTDEDEW